MVSVVSSNPTGGNFFFKDTSLLILYKNDRNVRFVLFTKTSTVYRDRFRLKLIFNVTVKIIYENTLVPTVIQILA